MRARRGNSWMRKAAERQQAQARLSEQERGLEAARQQVLRLLDESSA